MNPYADAHLGELEPLEPEILVPKVAWDAPGIMVGDQMVRTFVFTTDVAVVCNCDADAVLAVYPFIGQPVIAESLLHAAGRPVFTGAGGSMTPPERSIKLALRMRKMGISGVVVNMTFKEDAIPAMHNQLQGVPLVLSVCELNDETYDRIAAGASIANVAAGRDTAHVVAQIRANFPSLPIMASGGPTDASIAATIEAGANAVTWTPPNIQQMEHELMERSRAYAHRHAIKHADEHVHHQLVGVE